MADIESMKMTLATLKGYVTRAQKQFENKYIEVRSIEAIESEKCKEKDSQNRRAILKRLDNAQNHLEKMHKIDEKDQKLKIL